MVENLTLHTACISDLEVTLLAVQVTRPSGVSREENQGLYSTRMQTYGVL